MAEWRSGRVRSWRQALSSRRHWATGPLGHWVTIVCLSAMPALGDACPGCKEALFDPEQLAQKLSMAKGYALSIGLLLAVPCLLVGTIGFVVARSIRKSGTAPNDNSRER